MSIVQQWFFLCYKRLSYLWAPIKQFSEWDSNQGLEPTRKEPVLEPKPLKNPGNEIV